MKKAKIVVLAGQSNAVGVAHSKYLPEHFGEEKYLEYRNGYNNVKINLFSHNLKSGGFVPVKLGLAEKNRDTFGPEVGIAEYFTEKHPDEELFIVKCAFGGMSMFQDFLSPSGGETYDPEAYADQYDDIIKEFFAGKPIRAGWCYNELVRLMRESIKDLSANGYEPRIAAFCWMQGENDAGAKWCTDLYRDNYDAMLKDFSAEFGAWIDNCIYVDAGISESWLMYKEMNQIKADYAAEKENRRYIDTIGEGITTAKEPHERVDIHHYDSDSVIKLGRLFAENAGL